MTEFFAMSGYATYVWSSFGLGFGIVLLNVWLAKRSLAAAEQEARRRLEITRETRS